MATIAADLCWIRLFQLAPDVRRMYSDDLTEQKKELMVRLGTAVGGLAHLDVLMPAVQAVDGVMPATASPPSISPGGRRAALDLEQGLGNDFTPEVKTAWTTVYGVLSQTMIDAMYEMPKAVQSDGTSNSRRCRRIAELLVERGDRLAEGHPQRIVVAPVRL